MGSGAFARTGAHGAAEYTLHNSRLYQRDLNASRKSVAHLERVEVVTDHPFPLHPAPSSMGMSAIVLPSCKLDSSRLRTEFERGSIGMGLLASRWAPVQYALRAC